MKRKDILQQIIKMQTETIENLKRSVEDYRTAADLDEESTHDPEDFSHQNEAKDMQLRFEKSMNSAIQNLQFLEEEIEKTHDEVENGSLIETDKNYLFIGVSTPVFQIDGKEVVSFSDDAPVFENIKGKNIGDQVVIGDQKLTIQSIS